MLEESLSKVPKHIMLIKTPPLFFAGALGMLISVGDVCWVGLSKVLASCSFSYFLSVVFHTLNFSVGYRFPFSAKLQKKFGKET